MRENERELAYAVGGERARVEVLHDEDAVVDVQRLRHLERSVGVLCGHRAVAPRVAAGQRNTARGEPFGQLESGTRLAGEICGRIVPLSAPACVEQHGVPWFGFEADD